jgi:hypothetical protein
MTVVTASGMVAFTTGIFLTVARMFEPLFKLLVYKSIWQFWGEIYEPKKGEQTEEEQQIANDSLSTFLTSSLNVELVYIILSAITNFADKALPSKLILSNPMNASNPLSQSRRKIEEKFLADVTEECKKFRINVLKTIEIQDVTKWDTAKTKDFIQQTMTQET